MKRRHVRAAVEGVAVTLGLWLVFTTLLAVRRPRTPPVGNPTDLVLIGWIAEFLFLKSWVMLRRTALWDRLGAAIVAVNLSFCAVYALVLCDAFWPSLLRLAWLRQGERAELALVVTWGFVELVLLRDDA